jgi:heme/copper-type cytochrome/quinol oxidase subunit 1
MHFLGLAGMPRRIPDFPDVYLLWNQVASFGSVLTIFSLFYYILSLTVGRLYIPNSSEYITENNSIILELFYSSELNDITK